MLNSLKRQLEDDAAVAENEDGAKRRTLRDGWIERLGDNAEPMDCDPEEPGLTLGSQPDIIVNARVPVAENKTKPSCYGSVSLNYAPYDKGIRRN